MHYFPHRCPFLKEKQCQSFNASSFMHNIFRWLTTDVPPSKWSKAKYSSPKSLVPWISFSRSHSSIDAVNDKLCRKNRENTCRENIKTMERMRHCNLWKSVWRKCRGQIFRFYFIIYSEPWKKYIVPLLLRLFFNCRCVLRHF